MEREQIIEKVRKLMALANGSNFEAEATNAMLMAQKLMAKHNLEMTDVELEEVSKEVHHSIIDDAGVTPWKKALAVTIARNFRCMAYLTSHRGAQRITFIGFHEDVELASLVYRFALNVADKGAYKCYRKFRDKGLPAKGVRGDYYIGFVQGLVDKFAEQMTNDTELALVVTTPTEVRDAYENMPLGADKSKATTHRAGSEVAATLGYNDGKNLDMHKHLE